MEYARQILTKWGPQFRFVNDTFLVFTQKSCPSLTSWHFFLRCSRAMYLTWWGFLDGLRPLGSCLLFFFSKKNESYIDWQVQSFLGSPILTRYDISYLWRLSNCHAIHFSGKSEGVRKGTEDKYRWCNQWSFFRFCRETILNRVVVSMWETHPIRTPAALQPIARQCASSMRSLLLVFLWSSAGSIDLILTWLQWGKLMQSHSGNKYRLLNIERERYM